MSPEQTEMRNEIAREIAELHEESYGAGVTGLNVVLQEDVVLVLIDIELSVAERTLLDADQRDAVTSMREAFQRAVAPTFTAIVERATGRTVDSFSSHMNTDPLYSIEVFRLRPARA